MGLKRHCILVFGARSRGPNIRHTSLDDYECSWTGNVQIELAQNARTTLKVHMRACGSTAAAHRELPGDMHMSLGHAAQAALDICEEVGDPVSRTRVSGRRCLTLTGEA